MNTLVHFSKKYMLLLLAIVVLAGCKKEKIEEAEEQPMQEGPSMSVNVEARFELPDNLQKSYLKDDMVEWEDGDQIVVNNKLLTIHRHEGGVGYFHGDASTFNDAGAGAGNWFAVYPADLVPKNGQGQYQMLRDNKKQILLNIPQTQYYQEVDETNSKYLKDMNYMVAYTQTMTNNSISLQFVNLCAVLKIGLKAGPTSGHGAHLVGSEDNPQTQNSRVKKIVVYTSQADSVAFWGDCVVNSGSGKGLTRVTDNLSNLPAMRIPVISGATNKNRKLILDCTQKRVKDANGHVSYTTLSNGVGLSSTTTWFYIMVPINVILSNGLNNMCIEVFDGNGNMMKKILQGKTIQRNKVYTCDLGQLECQYSAKSFIDADFSVDATHTVKFTSGNLQYKPSTGAWRFATNQYDTVGVEGNAIGTAGNSYTKWIDLFPYGSSGKDNNMYPFTRCTNSTNSTFKTGTISKTDYDWGWYNNISDHPKHLFYTWTKSDVEYILLYRSASEVKGKNNARYAIGRAAGRNGIFLFPDVFELPSAIESNTDANNINIRPTSISGTNSTAVAHGGMTCTNAQLKSSGMVFLPCAGMTTGFRDMLSAAGSQRNCLRRYGVYSVSASENNKTSGYKLYLCWPYDNNNSNETSIASLTSFYNYYGYSVRLILSNY